MVPTEMMTAAVTAEGDAERTRSQRSNHIVHMREAYSSSRASPGYRGTKPLTLGYSSPTMRGRRLNQVMFLAAILAGGMLLAAHVPLHDYELTGAHHDDYDHQPVDHEHPVRTLVVAVLLVVLVVVAHLAPIAANLLKAWSPGFQATGAVRCDDDIGLHDLLSVYQI